MIEIRDVCKSHDGRRFVVDRVSLQVRQGELMVLLADPGDEYVARLLEMPKRQADRLEALAQQPQAA